MNGITKLMGVLSAGLVLLLINHLSFASNLIEPSRTLSGQAEKAGELFVFSEPPELDVKIDGIQIGKTPLILQEVAPGIHVIGVDNSETKIYIKPGKSTKLSWFKGAFIELPAEVKEVRSQQSDEKKEAAHIKMSEQPDERKEKPDPLYWPLNPKGPIY